MRIRAYFSEKSSQKLTREEENRREILKSTQIVSFFKYFTGVWRVQRQRWAWCHHMSGC